MWDDDETAPASNTSVQYSNHASKPFNTGFSVGKGRGFGNLKDVRNSLPEVGSNNYRSHNNASNDAWEDAPQNDSWRPQTNSGGRSWGTSNRDNSDRRNNNASSWSNKREDTDRWQDNKSNDTWRGGSDNVTRGGGFGSRGGGGGRVCHSCSQEGHISKDCPQKRRDGGRVIRREKGSGCFKCGEEGHISRECPNKDSDDKRNKGCFKCGEEGHMSRDCTNPGSGGGTQRGKGCFKCGEEGHMSRDCSTNPGSGGGTQRGKGCFNCNEEGHMSKDCPHPDKRVGPDGKPRPAPYIPPDVSNNENELFEAVQTGINFDKYDDIPVDVTGRDKSRPMNSFEEQNFCHTLAQNIKRSGYIKPTPVQKYAIPIILKKRDLMACAQTGSGKTAAFLIPMIQDMCTSNLPNNKLRDVQAPVAVIVAPTRELATQIYQEAQKFSYGSIVQCEVVYGGTSVGYQSSRIKRGCHILVATPGRLLDFVEKGKVSFEQLKYLVLDEADRMLDMGFIPSIRKMVENPDMPSKGQKQTLMFSATFPKEIQELAADFLDDYLFLTVGVVGAANTDVEQTFFKLERFDKRQKLLDILKETGNTRTLVFVEQKRTADFIASFISQNGVPTTSIHGDRLQKEREEALRDFRTGRMPVLIATAVAARGLDIRDVCRVINFDLPQTIDEYVHRIGRTGRVGNIGKAISFYDSSVDQPLSRALKGSLIHAQQEIPDWLSEEANSAVGATQHFGGRGNFGSRDVRNQGRSNRGGGHSDAWNNDFSSANSDNFSTNNDMSQPLCPDENWD